MGTGDSCPGRCPGNENAVVAFSENVKSCYCFSKELWTVFRRLCPGTFFRDVPVHINIQIVTTEKRGC